MTDLTKPSRRSVLRLGALAASAALLPGVGLFTPKTAEAQPRTNASTNAPKVSEQDAYHLFSLTVNTVENGLVDHHNYNLQTELRGYYNNTSDDRKKALAVSLVALGGLALADQAGREAVSRYSNYYEPVTGTTEYYRNDSIKKQIVDEYMSKSFTYGNKKMKFLREVATAANDLLWSANYGVYKTGNLASFLKGPAMSDPIFSPTRTAVIVLGILPPNGALALNKAPTHTP